MSCLKLNRNIRVGYRFLTTQSLSENEMNVCVDTGRSARDYGVATVTKEFIIAAPPAVVWAAIRNFGSPVKLFPGVLSDAKLDGDVRTVKFANGLVVRERLVTADDEARRLVWTVIEGRTTHHNGSLQVYSDDNNSRVVWITDFLPDTLKDPISQLVEHGSAAMKQALSNH